MTPEVTLDTNLILEYWKVQQRSHVVARLLELASSGVVDLAVTARIREDIPDAPLSLKISELQEVGFTETGSVTRLGFWQLRRDQLADADFNEFSTKIAELAATSGKRDPDWRDWDHLHAHYLQGRDVFLTWDKGILAIADSLQSEFGIIVTTPEEYLGQMGHIGQ